jgi:tetratricopeptide (TPR) repeat protein
MYCFRKIGFEGSDYRMAGENDFINNFVPKSRFITAATQTGVEVSKFVFFQKDNLGNDCRYVGTGCSKILNNGILYTDEISSCSGLALWSPGRAGLFHIVPGTSIEDIETFLSRYANGPKALPQLVFIATWPEHTPSGVQNDKEARDSSLYAALCALLKYYGESIKQVTMIITGFCGRRWTHEAQLAVSAVYGISVAIPGRGKEDKALDLKEEEVEVARLEKSLNPYDPIRLAAEGNLAVRYYKQGEYRKAEFFFNEHLATAKRALGPEHPQVASSLHNLGLLYGNQGRYDEAKPLFNEARDIWERTLGPEHPKVATCKRNYLLLLEKEREAEGPCRPARRAKNSRGWVG